jgi:uncharacterized membrane protein YciS (DUF1049 family)
MATRKAEDYIMTKADSTWSTILFGVLAIILALASLLVAYLQYKKKIKVAITRHQLSTNRHANVDVESRYTLSTV